MTAEQQIPIPAYDGKEPFIFLSYSHADNEKVMYFIRRMSENGYRIWYDEGIKINDDYQNTIQKKIKESSYFIAFITERYLTRKDPLQEMLIAMDLRDKKKLKVIPIYLEEFDLDQLHEQAILWDSKTVEEAIGRLIYQNFKDIQGLFAYGDQFNDSLISKVQSQIDDSCRASSYDDLWKKACEEDTIDAYAIFIEESSNEELKKKATKRILQLLYEGKTNKSTNQKDQIEVGDVLDERYQIEKVLGQGGMGKVYLAFDNRLNMYWAIKEMKLVSEVHLLHSLFEEMALSEVNLMKQLKHHSIPRVVDLIKRQKALYIVMDYIDGPTLDSLINVQGALPEKMVIQWALDLCEVLSYLHSRKPAIIYRDLKPSNIAINSDGQLMLMDFGIAKEYKENNLNDTVILGTKGYAAPEQYDGQTDERTDIYSLGITLYQLVTSLDPNKPPYEIIPIREVNPKFSKILEKIILKCTRPNPEERYQSSVELRDELKKIDEHPPSIRLLYKLIGRKKKDKMDRAFNESPSRNEDDKLKEERNISEENEERKDRIGHTVLLSEFEFINDELNEKKKK